MKLKTIKQRFSLPRDAYRIVVVMLGCKSWTVGHVDLLAQALSVEKKRMIGRKRSMMDYVDVLPKTHQPTNYQTMPDMSILLVELDSIPEWAKLQIIFHDSDLGELFFNMKIDTKNAWILMK